MPIAKNTALCTSLCENSFIQWWPMHAGRRGVSAHGWHLVGLIFVFPLCPKTSGLDGPKRTTAGVPVAAARCPGNESTVITQSRRRNKAAQRRIVGGGLNAIVPSNGGLSKGASRTTKSLRSLFTIFSETERGRSFSAS